MLVEGEINEIKWVNAKKQIADGLTKGGAGMNKIREFIRER